MMQIDGLGNLYHLALAEIPAFTFSQKDGIPLLKITLYAHGSSLDSLRALMDALGEPGARDLGIKVYAREGGKLIDPETGVVVFEAKPLSNGEQMTLPTQPAPEAGEA